MRFHILIILTLGLVTLPPGSAQVSAVTGNGPMPTLAEQLQQHHIALTQPALVAALRNREPDIRELAAMKLAENGTKEAIPEIEAALKSEAVGGAKVNIAFALAQLEDSIGIRTLTDTCNNPVVNAGLRLRAAEYMLDLKSNACLSAVNDVLRSRRKDDADYRMEAVSLIPNFKDISKGESRELFESALISLTDPMPAVRISASDALAKLGDRAAVPYLKNAIAEEQEAEIRAQLENALRQLQLKKK